MESLATSTISKQEKDEETSLLKKPRERKEKLLYKTLMSLHKNLVMTVVSPPVFVVLVESETLKMVGIANLALRQISNME